MKLSETLKQIFSKDKARKLIRKSTGKSEPFRRPAGSEREQAFRDAFKKRKKAEDRRKKDIEEANKRAKSKK